VQIKLSVGVAKIDASTARAVAAEKLTADARSALLERITTSTDLHSLAHVDIVIEAVPEDLDLKRRVLGELDAIVPQHCISGDEYIIPVGDGALGQHPSPRHVWSACTSSIPPRPGIYRDRPHRRDER
jgi:hypothetical protein